MEDKKKGFSRLLADMQEDSFHGELVETRDFLPKIAQSQELEGLRGRLRKRYQRSRISATTMYMPRIALTFAVMMTCAVAFLYIQKIHNIKPLVPKDQNINVDSLMKELKNKK
jgi:hypothetical protein